MVMSILLALDPVLLSRVQFALTIMFHYLFPPLTIGMGVVLVYLEGMYLWRKDPIYETAAQFWTQLFALNFALGVATGITMEFEFGTNWALTVPKHLKPSCRQKKTSRPAPNCGACCRSGTTPFPAIGVCVAAT